MIDKKTIYTDNIICPYCGYESRDSIEYIDNDGDFIECLDCEKEFLLNVYKTVEYSTFRKESEDE